MKSILTALLLSILTIQSTAGSYSGMIRPRFYGSVLYLDIISGSRSPAACVALSRGYLRLQETDPADPVFKEKYAMLLANWNAGKTVSITGTGTCTSEGDEMVFELIPN